MMRMVLPLVAVLLTVAATGIAPLVAQTDPAAEVEATEAARGFLELLDAGEYRASWEAAAPLFQSSITPERWEETMLAARASIGSVQAREHAGTRFVSDIPGAPRGEYAIVEFRSRFETLPASRERVVMMNTDGRWMPVGAFVLPPES